MCHETSGLVIGACHEVQNLRCIYFQCRAYIYTAIQLALLKKTSARVVAVPFMGLKAHLSEKI